MNQPCNKARPTGLMTRAESGAVVAMEVFIKQYVVTPMGIGLEFLGTSINRAPARTVPEEG